MANFPPLKQYMFFCFDRIIAQYHLKQPFLDIGCGIGDVSSFLAKKGWRGKAIDISSEAISRAHKNLNSFPGVQVAKKNFLEEEGSYRTVILWDCLEHFEDDRTALKKIYSLLCDGGHLLIAVPTNPREWRWDDTFYGHYRRYKKCELDALLVSCDFTPVLWWDFTFPFFWIMRRAYFFLIRKPKVSEEDKEKNTKKSSTVNFWSLPTTGGIFNPHFFLWTILYNIQFGFFKTWISSGHEAFVLVRKNIRKKKEANV